MKSKIYVPILLLYILLITTIVWFIYQSLLVGLLFFWVYVLFSRTYFLNTFLPFCNKWIKNVLANKHLAKFLDAENVKWVALITNLWIGLKDPNSIHSKQVKYAGYIAFLLLPILVTSHFYLYLITRK